MAGQMGMEDPFYNDRPMVHHDNYEYAIISLYTTSIVLGIKIWNEVLPCAYIQYHGV